MVKTDAMGLAVMKADQIKLHHEQDLSPYTDDIGEYVDEPEPWAILRQESEYVANLPESFEMPSRGREYRFFKPYAGGAEPGTADYQKYGKQDFQQMENLNNGLWWFIGIYASAEVTVGGVRQTIRSGGVWQVPSDSREAITEVEAQQEMELRAILNLMGIEHEGAQVVS